LVRPAEFVTSLRRIFGLVVFNPSFSIGWFVNIVTKWRIPKTHHEIPKNPSVNICQSLDDLDRHGPPGVWTSLKDVQRRLAYFLNGQHPRRMRMVLEAAGIPGYPFEIVAVRRNM
jgi:hypothetical protein